MEGFLESETQLDRAKSNIECANAIVCLTSSQGQRHPRSGANVWTVSMIDDYSEGLDTNQRAQSFRKTTTLCINPDNVPLEHGMERGDVLVLFRVKFLRNARQFWSMRGTRLARCRPGSGPESLDLRLSHNLPALEAEVRHMRRYIEDRVWRTKPGSNDDGSELSSPSSSEHDANSHRSESTSKSDSELDIGPDAIEGLQPGEGIHKKRALAATIEDNDHIRKRIHSEDAEARISKLERRLYRLLKGTKSRTGRTVTETEVHDMIEDLRDDQARIVLQLRDNTKTLVEALANQVNGFASSVTGSLADLRAELRECRADVNELKERVDRLENQHLQVGHHGLLNTPHDAAIDTQVPDMSRHTNTQQSSSTSGDSVAIVSTYD